MYKPFAQASILSFISSLKKVFYSKAKSSISFLISMVYNFHWTSIKKIISCIFYIRMTCFALFQTIGIETRQSSIKPIMKEKQLLL